MPKMSTDELFPSIGLSTEVLISRLNDIIDSIQDVFNSSAESLDQHYDIAATPYEVPGIGKRGSGMLIVFGESEGTPAAVFTCVKSTSNANGDVAVQSSQSGTGDYAAENYSCDWLANQSIRVSVTATTHRARVQWIGS